jgi:hypothetical protein
MKNMIRWAAAGAAGFLAITQAFAAVSDLRGASTLSASAQSAGGVFGLPKAASAQSFGSRGTVTSSATMYGAFQITQRTTVYILVRGNSLQTLGVTNNYLDAPRVRLYDAGGSDLVTDGTRPGFNACVSSNEFNVAVVSYYQNVRNQPVNERDGCLGVILDAGVYTFSVTPSIPGVTTTTGQSNPASGEVLFEITLNP